MTRLVVAALLSAVCAIPSAAQDPAAAAQIAAPSAIVRSVSVAGARELSDQDCLSAAGVHVGAPIPDSPERVAAAVEAHYHDRGYTFARVSAAWDEAAGALTLTVDEGVIESVAFVGVDKAVAARLADDFALKKGDVFNRSRAREALQAVLRQTRGAITASKSAFDLVDTDHGRELRVDLNERTGRFRLAPDLGDREDWFTPVDGFVPSFGFGAAVFDLQHFNHAFVAGHISYKTASEQVGYSLGFEKPFFGARKLFVGGELYDLTATDDDWRVSSFEASLDAIAVRDSFRDYYRRRGIQITAAFRPRPRAELFAAWRDQREESQPVATDFSLWNSDESFRPNLAAADGRLHALIVGASLDGRGFGDESLEGTYHRHQLGTAYGERLRGLRRNDGSLWRVDWQTEISSPGAFDSDFDFTRTIVSGRYRTMLSPHQEFGARAIGGWSSGILPPQRTFAVGGIGSVEAYPFKAQLGDSMALLNLEYALGWRQGPRVFGLYDIGRATAAGADAPWLEDVGFGLGIGDSFRVDFTYRTNDIPGSLVVFVRFGRTF